jgi:hypothetical protein
MAVVLWPKRRSTPREPFALIDAPQLRLPSRGAHHDQLERLPICSGWREPRRFEYLLQFVVLYWIGFVGTKGLRRIVG